MGVGKVGKQDNRGLGARLTVLAALSGLGFGSVQPAQAQTSPEPTTEFRYSLSDSINRVVENSVKRFELRFPDQVGEAQLRALSALFYDAQNQQERETPYLRSLDLPNPYNTSLQQSPSFYELTYVTSGPVNQPQAPVFVPAPPPQAPQPVRSLW